MSDNAEYPPDLAVVRAKLPSRARKNASAPVFFVIISVVFAPVFLLFQAWRTSSERYRHWLLTAFVTVYGSTIGIAYDPLGQGSDGVRHLLRVHTHYLELEFSEFSRELFEIITFEYGTAVHADVYAHVLSYFVGSILGMPGLFFTFVAFVYGYFFSGSIVRIFRGLQRAQLPVLVLFIFLNFFLIKNIEGVNTVRTWTGLWVLVYAGLHYHETKRLRYLVLMAAPPFIHFGFFIMAIPAYVVVVLGSRTALFSLIFVASSFTTFINPGSFEEIASQTDLGEHRFSAYQRDSVADVASVIQQSRAADQRVWRVLQRAGVQKWALNLFIYTIIFTGLYKLSMSAFEKRIFSTGLITLIFSNSFWFLSAMSNRSWIIGAVFIGSAFILMRIRSSREFKVPISPAIYRVGMITSAVLFAPFVLYNLSTLLDFPSVFLLFFPFVVWLQPEVNMTLKEGLQLLMMIMR